MTHERKSRPEAALQNQSGQTKQQHYSTESLALAGWRFERFPRRTFAKLRHADRSLISMEVHALVNTPKYMAALSDADQNEVREMAFQGVTA